MREYVNHLASLYREWKYGNDMENVLKQNINNNDE